VTSPTFTSESAFQGAVVRAARERGWGMTEQAWERQQEEAQAYASFSGDAAALLARMEGWTYHTRYSLGSDRGMPDLLLVRLRDRRVLFRELKTDRGKLSARQAAVLDLLAAVGMDAGVWRPADWDRILEELR